MPLDDRFHSLALFSDLQTRKLTTRDGSSFTLSPVTVGDTLLCTLTVQQRIDSEVREIDLPVRSLVASIGRIHEPPTKGTFTLHSTTPSRAVLEIVGATRIFQLRVEEEPGSTIHGGQTLGTNLAEDLAHFRQFFTITEPSAGTLRVIHEGPEGLRLWAEINITGEITTVDAYSVAAVSAESQPIPFDAEADAVLAAFAGLDDLSVSKETAGCWIIARDSGDDFGLSEGVGNRLEPASFVRIRKFQRFGSAWAYEVRLVQQPIATNEAGFSRVLAPPPTVEQIAEGDPGTEATPATDEIQALKIHPDFRGTYRLEWKGYRSRILGIEDGPDQIAEALNAMFEGSTETRFEVTVAEANQANIQFVGPLGGSPHPEISVTVVSFSPGVLTFALPLTRAEAHHALRLVKEVEMPFEVSVEIGDPDAPETPGRELTLFRVPIKVERELNAAGQDAVQKIEWQNSRPPRDYIPFTPDQIITGSQHYVATFGNGAARTFEFAHNLGTSAFTFLVRENVANGKALVLGTHYDATFPSNNALSLALLPTRATPAANALALVITSAGPKSAFQAHTHTIEQVLTLGDILATLAARVDNLEDLLPTTTVARREERTEPTEIEFPDVLELYPGRLGEDFNLASLADGSKDAPPLPRPGALVPAMHDAAAEALPLPLPLASGASASWGESGNITMSNLPSGSNTFTLNSSLTLLQAGSVIRFNALLTEYTVQSVVGTTVTLTSNAVTSIAGGATIYLQVLNPYAGRVFQNQSGAAVTVPGSPGSGRASKTVEPLGYVGNDGRFWYKVAKHGATNSFFPADLERELVRFHVSPEMWQPGERLQLTFELSLRTYAANSNVQCLVVIEAGTAPQETQPAPVGPNLERIEWAAKPLLETRVLISSAKQKHKFGALLKRSATGLTITGERLNYTAWTQAPAESLPTEAGVVLRARVIGFDTENNAKTATGFVFLNMSEARAIIA